MPTIIIKVDLDCDRCHGKIEKVLNRIREKGEFVIDDIQYDEKNNRVTVTGPFDADRLADKLCCKACKIIKEIEIVEPPPKKEKSNPPPTEKKEKPPDKQHAPAPSTKDREVPYPWPYPYPYPCPAWPSDCCCHHGHGGCHCCSCGKQEAPAPAPPPTQYIMPQYPPPTQYKIVCEEDPSYACVIM